VYVPFWTFAHSASSVISVPMSIAFSASLKSIAMTLPAATFPCIARMLPSDLPSSPRIAVAFSKLADQSLKCGTELS
jgi:hypothetical protein